MTTDAENSKPVLVFHSDTSVEESICEALRECGIEDIEKSTDGDAALKKTEDNELALALVGNKGDEQSGLEFVQKLRESENSACNNLPVIWILDEPHMQRVVKAFSAGVSDIIICPLTPEKMKTRIDRWSKRNH